MTITLSNEARQYIALFEDVTDATARDCLLVEDGGDAGEDGEGGEGNDSDATGSTASGSDATGGDEETDERVVFLVKPGDMAKAIGSGGETVRKLEDQLGKDVMLVEDADTAEAFVANALAPAAVYNVTISENDETIAYAEVDSEDTGVAIGSGGRNIEIARMLADRHFGVDDVQLT